MGTYWLFTWTPSKISDQILLVCCGKIGRKKFKVQSLLTDIVLKNTIPVKYYFDVL